MKNLIIKRSNFSHDILLVTTKVGMLLFRYNVYNERLTLSLLHVKILVRKKINLTLGTLATPPKREYETMLLLLYHVFYILNIQRYVSTCYEVGTKHIEQSLHTLLYLTQPGRI